MKNTLLAILCLLLMAACGPKELIFDPDLYDCDTTVVNTHPKGNAFQLFLEEKVAEGLPGISMLVASPEGIWTGAAGVAEIPYQTPMKACNIHKIGSTTKTFTAMLIFRLYEQGRLDLDDPIRLYLPLERISQVANAETATIRQLLSHSSGIPNYLDIAYTFNYYDDLERIWTAEEELSMVYGEPAVFAPGEKVDYSNTNYLLLGMLAEQLTGETPGTLMQEWIFDEVGMGNTFFSETGRLPTSLVRGYVDENGKGNFIDITHRAYARSSVAGGGSSTVEDLYAFLRATWASNDLLTDSTRSLITTPVSAPFLSPETFDYGGEDKVNRISGIGLCWFQYDTDYGICYGHDGGFDGRRSVMRYFPDSDTYLVYLVNGSGASLKSTLRQMRRNDVVELIFE